MPGGDDGLIDAGLPDCCWSTLTDEEHALSCRGHKALMMPTRGRLTGAGPQKSDGAGVARHLRLENEAGSAWPS
jgi:hypothetical protein